MFIGSLITALRNNGHHTVKFKVKDSKWCRGQMFFDDRLLYFQALQSFFYDIVHNRNHKRVLEFASVLC